MNGYYTKRRSDALKIGKHFEPEDFKDLYFAILRHPDFINEDSPHHCRLVHLEQKVNYLAELMRPKEKHERPV